MQAVLFDLDQTLHDRAASRALYIAEHHGRLGFSHVALETYHAKFVALDGGGYTGKSALFGELVRHFDLPIEAGALLLDFRQRLGLHCQLFSDAFATLRTLRERADIGTVEVTTHPDHFHLGEFYLLPQFQRQGTGTYLLGHVLDEAGEQGLAVRLEVLKNNPVQSLYRRHGFLVVGQREHHF